MFGRDVPFHGWHYPPFFFAVAILVAAIPYAAQGSLLAMLAASSLAWLWHSDAGLEIKAAAGHPGSHRCRHRRAENRASVILFVPT